MNGAILFRRGSPEIGMSQTFAPPGPLRVRPLGAAASRRPSNTTPRSGMLVSSSMRKIDWHPASRIGFGGRRGRQRSQYAESAWESAWDARVLEPRFAN
jgi:hypothetical protein